MTHSKCGRSIFFILLLSMSSVSVCYAIDQVSILPSNRYIATNDRGVVTLSFDIRNETQGIVRFEEKLDLPSGWTTLSTLVPIILQPGESRKRLVHLSISKNSAPKNYSVNYRLLDTDSSDVFGSERIDVGVTSIIKEEISATNIPTSLFSSEKYNVSFNLKNLGNSTKKYRINVKDPDGFVRSVSQRLVVLNAGESALINVLGKVSERLLSTKVHRITFEAKSNSGVVSHEVSIKTIPNVPVGLGRYHYLAGNLVAKYKAESRGSDPSFSEFFLNYDAQGALDNAGKHNLRLQLRTTEQITGDSDPADDYYQLQYWNNNWSTILGDLRFRNGRVMGHELSGLGAEAKYSVRSSTNGNVTARFYKGQERDNNSEKISGAEVKYRNRGQYFGLKDQMFEVGISYAKHELKDEEYNLQGFSALFSDKNVTLRGAYAKDDEDSGRKVDFIFRKNNLALSYNHRQGGANFSGGYSDSRQNYLSLNWKQGRSGLRLNARRTEVNLANDPSRSSLESQVSSLSYIRTLGKNKNIDFEVGLSREKSIDLQLTTPVHNNVDSLFVSYQHALKMYDIKAKLEYGEREDFIRGNGSSQGYGYELALGWKATDALKLNFTYEKDNDLDSDGVRNDVGLSASFKLNGHQRLSGYYQRSSGDQGNYNNSGFTYFHELRNRHVVRIHGSYGESDSDDSDKIVGLTYSVPLDIPLRKRRDVGSIKGTVVSSRTSEPLKNVALKLNGTYSVTDEKGKFYYPNILAKDYSLQVDPSRSIDGGGYMLNDLGSALDVKLKAGEVKQVNLSLSKGAGVSGRVVKLGLDKLNGKLTEEGGMDGVLLELMPISKNIEGGGTRRIYTNSNGDFSFYGLPLGRWQISVQNIRRLDKNYRLEQSLFILDLKNGESEPLIIKAVPKNQKVEKVGPASGFSISG